MGSDSDSGSRPAILISFSGIDGAGKSTQIDHLCATLRDAGLLVSTVVFWDDVAALKRLREDTGHRIFRGDKGVGTPQAPIHRRDKNVRSPLMTLLRLGMYLLDALSLRRVSACARRSGADIVIFDRYIYDELANLNLRNPAVCLCLRALIPLVVHPHISFILDADPAQARARKPEYPIEFLHLNRNAYLALSSLVGGIVVIPPLPLPEAKAEVVRSVLARLPRHDLVSGPKTRLDGPDARPVAF